MAMTLVHGPAYAGRRTLVVTGERAEESPGRALYKTFETHRAHAKKRHVDHWRPVHAWLEDRVWEIIRRNGVVPHPAYYLGWGRLSCMTCVFISPNQWASIRAIAPERFEAIANYETQFGFTIQRKLSVRQLAEKGTPYPAALSGRASEALETSWNGTVLVRPEDWVMPAGAFGENAGPL